MVFFADQDSAIAYAPGQGQLRTMSEYISGYGGLDVLAFAIAGPTPQGCQLVSRGNAEPCRNYGELTAALGGTSASICAEDLSNPINEILVAVAGAASNTTLADIPISGSLEVSLADAPISRNRTDGFDYQPTANSAVFFGDAFPDEGTEFRVTYLRFDPASL